MIGRPKIEGRVAKVLNERELVINRGSEHDVEEDMVFEIVDSESEQVVDPETGEPIGALNPVKNYVKVTEVQPRMSIAATYISWRTEAGPLTRMSALPNLFAPSRTEYDTIESDEPELGEGRDLKVRIGDLARQARKLPT